MAEFVKQTAEFRTQLVCYLC